MMIQLIMMLMLLMFFLRFVCKVSCLDWIRDSLVLGPSPISHIGLLDVLISWLHGQVSGFAEDAAMKTKVGHHEKNTKI